MITPEAAHAIQRAALLHNDPIPSVFADTTLDVRSHQFRFGYQAYILELSDSSAIIRPVGDPFGDEGELRKLYAEFNEEDIALANEGLAEFKQVMQEYDGK